MPPPSADSLKRDVHWPTVLYYIHLHALGIYGLLLLFTEAKWMTVFFTLFIILWGALGVTVGAHRLWSHSAFQASGLVRAILMIGHTFAGVGNIYDWVVSHRLHHMYYGTDRDPYNHKKGFLYSHLISNVLTGHPDKERLDRDVDMTDVDSDGYVWIQRWFYWLLFPIVGLLLPLNAPVEYWDESIKNSLFILIFFRLMVLCNLSWLVNSAMLIWGLKPGDKLRNFVRASFDMLSLLNLLFLNRPSSHGAVKINRIGVHCRPRFPRRYPPEDNTIFLLSKSYWPNYHYMLPWDYKCGEFGNYDRGCSTFFIKMWENLGLVDSLKTASSDAIRDALYKAASDRKISVAESLEAVRKIADEEAIKAKLRYRH